MVGFRLDHVVIRVYDLAAATASYTALGFHVVPGGEHPGLGSRNTLIAFEDDSYLELIAFGSSPPRRILPRHVRLRELAGRSAQERHWLPWESSSEGVIDFALTPSSIEDAITAAHARGLQVEGPFPGGRLRPDGQRVGWQLGLAESLDLPFLCADVTARSLRVPMGKARRHANGVKGVARVAVAVNDLNASLKRYLTLLGEQKSDLHQEETTRQAELMLGSTYLLLEQPNNVGGRIAERLVRHGEGPWRVQLRGGNGARAQAMEAMGLEVGA
jgi:catechol 2,3-dioxygenase-like lactoylglutathione lyase family enzyme